MSLDGCLKADNEKLILQRRVIEDEFAAERLLYQQNVIDLQQTIILNHIHKSNEDCDLLFIDLMDDNTQKILNQQCEKWKAYRTDLEEQKEALLTEKSAIEQLQESNEDNLLIIAELNHQNHEYKTQIHEYNDALIQMQNESQIQQIENVHLNEQIKALKQKISDIEESNKSLSSSLDTKHDKHQALLVKYNTLETDLNEQRYMQQTTDTKLRQYERELNDIKLTTNELQNKLDTKQKTMSSLQIDIENKVMTHKEIVFEYKEKMNALTLSNANKNNELMQIKQHTHSQLLSWNETKELMIKQQNDVTKELKARNESLDRLKEEYNALKQEYEQNAKVSQSEVDDIQNKQQTLSNHYANKCKAFDELYEKYENDTNEYQDKIQKMNANVDKLVNVEIYALNHKIMEYDEDNKYKMNEIQCKIKENKVLKEDNGELKQKLNQLRNELNHNKSTINKLEQNTNTQHIELKQFRESLKAKEEELKSLRSNHERIVYKSTKLETVLHEIRNLHETTKKDSKIEQDSLRSKYDDKCAKFYELKQLSDKQINNAKHELTAAKTRITELETNLNELSALKMRLEENKKSLNDKLKKLEHELCEKSMYLKHSKENIQNVNEKNNEMIHRLAEKEEELKIFKATYYKQLEKKYDALMIKYDTEYNNFKQKLSDTKKECDEKVTNCRQSLEGKENKWIKSRKEYERNLKLMNDEMNEYKLKYSEAEIKCNYLEEQYQDLSFNLEEIKTERLQLKDKNEIMVEQLAELREMQMEADNERNEIEERVKSINAENDDLYQQNMNKEDELNELNETVDNLKVNYEDLIEENKEIKCELSELQTKYDAVDNNYISLQDKYEIDMKQNDIKLLEMNQKTELFKEENVAKNDEMQRLKREINETKLRMMTQHNEKINDLQNEMKHKQKEYETFKFENESLQKQIAKLEKNIVKLKDEHTANRDSSELIIKSLQNNLKQLQNTKQIQLNSLKETQQNLKNVDEEMKVIKKQHMQEIKILNDKLKNVYEDKLKSKGKEYETMDCITNKMQTLEADLIALKKENEALDLLQKELKSELEANEQKMEEDELKIITLKNENEQLNDNKMEQMEKLSNLENALKDKNGKIKELNQQLLEDGGSQTKLRVKFDEIESLYNDIMIQNKYITNDKECTQQRLNTLQAQYDAMCKEFGQCKNTKPTKEILNEQQIKIEILEKELADEQKEKKKVMLMMDELKIKNYSLLADLKTIQEDKENILCLQNLQVRNEKLSKKIKIQQAKIEMYKKKLNKLKTKNRKASNPSALSVSCGSLLNISSASDLLSPVSSVSSSNSRNHKKRKYDEMMFDERVLKKARHS